MEFILDTRNQKDSFVEESLHDLGHTTDRLELYFGDVAIKGKLHSAIDLKSSGGGLIELIKNVCSKDHARLKREIEKVVRYGGTLTFLCFEEGITCIDDITKYKIPNFKSTCWKTCYYDNKQHQKAKMPQIKALFNKLVKNNQVILNGTYDSVFKEWLKQNYYTKKELSHTQGEKFTKISLETFKKALKTMSEPNHYGEGITIKFEFTTKEQCGKKIIEILGG